jgi:hypothetical protein
MGSNLRRPRAEGAAGIEPQRREAGKGRNGRSSAVLHKGIWQFRWDANALHPRMFSAEPMDQSGKLRVRFLLCAFAVKSSDVCLWA